MGKFVGSIGVVTSIVIGAVVWFVLDVIIGVAVWISFVAGGVVAIVGVLLALGIIGAASHGKKSRSSHREPFGAH